VIIKIAFAMTFSLAVGMIRLRVCLSLTFLMGWRSTQRYATLSFASIARIAVHPFTACALQQRFSCPVAMWPPGFFCVPG
jgi:hypothetical protein